ncbi:hypothetical protein AN958_09282 [Leucoagaricus sp. SymC.cos]|nr:hypothetical protein AN958_09282 [Leucoagaricus sp. SymC.cos]
MINKPFIPSVLDLANLFELSSDAFYQALSPLSPFIITIPYGKLAAKQSLHLNPSFLDMMASPEQIPWLTEASTRQFPERVTRAYFYALSKTNIALSQCLTWKSETGDPETNLRVAHDLARLAAAHTWKTCIQITLFGRVLRDRIRAFDFRRLQRFASSIPVNDFWRFLRWIVKAVEDNRILASLSSIIRSKPEFDLDFKLVEQCRKIAKPLDLDFKEPRAKALRDSPRYVLLGLRRQETIIVILIPDAVTIYSVDDLKYLE